MTRFKEGDRVRLVVRPYTNERITTEHVGTVTNTTPHNAALKALGCVLVQFGAAEHWLEATWLERVEEVGSGS
jgi:hypothetical protein